MTVAPPTTCEHCGKPFTPKRRNKPARLCSDNCYSLAWRVRNRDKYRLAQAKNYYKHHGKSEARWQVKLALLEGRLVRPTTCSDCGKASKYIDAHHHNGYDEPHWLDVIWLCKKCHGRLHRKPASQKCVFGCTRKATVGVDDELATCDRCHELVRRIIDSFTTVVVA